MASERDRHPYVAWGTGCLAIGLVLVSAMASLGEGVCRTPWCHDPQVARKHIRSWTEMRNQNIVMQRRDYSCGAAALATVLQYHWGDSVAEEAILRVVGRMLTAEEIRDRIKNGLSLTDLRRAAVRLGYLASIGKLDIEQLAQARVPLVLGIRSQAYEHFVVFRGTDLRLVYLADPSRGNLRIPTPRFLEQWQKNMVLVVVKRDAAEDINSPLMVQPGEERLGALNRHVVRRFYVKPPRLFPTAIRP